MILPRRGRAVAPLACAFFALASAGVAQTGATPSAQEDSQQRISFGIRVRTLPVRSMSVMDNGRTLNTAAVNKVTYDWNYTTTSSSLALGGALVVEGILSPRWLVSAEFVYSPLKYTKVTDQYSGADDPTTSNDERSHKTTTEETKARYYDFPVLLRHNARATGFLSHLYLMVGPSLRLASTVKTTTNITNADGTREANHNAAALAKRMLIGGTVGAGFRFMDDFKIKVAPEVRFTRWNGMTFAQDSTRSPRNQFELSLTFTR